MQYRRTNIKGGTYFFTVNLAERKKTLLVDEIDKLRTAINKVKQRHPFKLDTMVVLPDHLHAIMTLPEEDNDYEKHVDYIHYNPVKHGYVKRPVDWSYSSIHQYISRGTISQDWEYIEDNMNPSF